MEDDMAEARDEEQAREFLMEMLYEDLRDMGILDYDSYSGGDSSIERWWITYFDEAGVEYNTKIKI